MEVIHPDPPMQEEIKNGFYPQFENGWRKAEICGRALMVLFISANVLGAFGRGLFSETTRANDDHSIEITYEPIVRFGAPTMVTLDTRVPPGGDKVAVTMSTELADLFGLERITPSPSRWEAGDAGIRMEFPVLDKAERVLVRFSGSPSFRGGTKLWAKLDKGEMLSWSQYSVP